MSLTASIVEVVGQIVLRVVARYVALADQIGEGIARDARQLGRFAEGKYALCVKRNGQFRAQARLNLRLRQADAVGDGFGNVEVVRH